MHIILTRKFHDLLTYKKQEEVKAFLDSVGVEFVVQTESKEVELLRGIKRALNDIEGDLSDFNYATSTLNDLKESLRKLYPNA